MADSLESHIRTAFQEVFREHCNGKCLPDVSADSILLETGLDSLGFAILVVRLEESLGFDPFILSPEPYYPRTFGDFVSFYEAYQPR